MTVKTVAEVGFEVGRGQLDWSAMDRRPRAEFEELVSESVAITVDPRARSSGRFHEPLTGFSNAVAKTPPIR